MTLEEFIKQTTIEVRKLIKDEEYISKLLPDMEKEYRDSEKLIPILGSRQLSPAGYAYGISLMYPDLP